MVRAYLLSASLCESKVETRMGRKIYFDTNIFDHLVKGIGITEAEERALRSAVNSGHISVLLSYLNLGCCFGAAAISNPPGMFRGCRP
jgi:hypothetical protein